MVTAFWLTLVGCGGAQVADSSSAEVIMSSVSGRHAEQEQNKEEKQNAAEPPAAASSEETEPASGASTEEPDAPPASEGNAASPEMPEGHDEGDSQQEGAPQPDCLQDYDYTQPVPECEEIGLEYFDNAAFIGDSRTDGFLLFSGIGRGRNLTSNGLSIFSLSTKKALTIGGTSYTLLEALGLEKFGKVYISLGVNELGYNNDERFYQSYCQAIDSIRAVQPDAVIYIQGLIPVNEKDAMAYLGKSYLKNDHLRVYNDLMRKVAQEKQVMYLDLYSAFADETGELPSGASRDGVHLTKEYCRMWLAYLQTHAVVIGAQNGGT